MKGNEKDQVPDLEIESDLISGIILQRLKHDRKFDLSKEEITL